MRLQPYFGLKSPKNRVRWIIFGIFSFFAFVIFAIWVPSRRRCISAVDRVEATGITFDDCGDDSDLTAECQEAILQCSRAQGTNFMWILFVIAASVPLFTMCCCPAPPPPQQPFEAGGIPMGVVTTDTAIEERPTIPEDASIPPTAQSAAAAKYVEDTVL